MAAEVERSAVHRHPGISSPAERCLVTTTLLLISLAIIAMSLAVVVGLLRSAAGRRPKGTTETILQVDAENRSVFDKSKHEAWDGEVRITRPTDPRIIKQIQRLNARDNVE